MGQWRGGAFGGIRMMGGGGSNHSGRPFIKNVSAYALTYCRFQCKLIQPGCPPPPLPQDFLRRHGIEPLPDRGGETAVAEKRARATVDEACPKCGNPQLEYYTMQACEGGGGGGGGRGCRDTPRSSYMEEGASRRRGGGGPSDPSFTPRLTTAFCSNTRERCMGRVLLARPPRLP